ncbi:MAG: TldD/PmbA family protein [Bacteroidaceae bacterium]|nr:TldD/PmbA family protein [Bacteroidaceae bacterium]
MNPDLFSPILAAALSRGGQYADIYAEDTTVTSIELQDGRVSQAQQAVLYGAGIRVIHDGQTGYAYTMDLSPDSLLRAARFAGSISGSAAVGNQKPVTAPENFYWPAQETGKTRLPHNLDPPPAQSATVPSHQVRQLLLRLDEEARQSDPRIIRVKAALTQRIQRIQFANSRGEAYTDQRPRTALVVRIVMEQGGETQMGMATSMMQLGADFVTEERIQSVITKAVSRAAFLFDAVQPKGGEMPVVMAAGGSGILLHEAIGHAFEADFIRQGTSIFTGQLGRQICSPDITIVDDGTQPGDAGMLRWDDEGVPGQRTTLVREGRLESYLYDRISADHFHVKPTGNGRRESFRHVPQPRMRSTYMLAGQATEEDIIRSVRRGIYAQVFTNGQVQIGAGDFTFYMKQGYLIEDGRLTRPIRDVNIIGNGPQALRDISMVADNLLIDHSASMCGKGGQSVPVSQGLPTVLINKLIVG